MRESQDVDGSIAIWALLREKENVRGKKEREIMDFQN